jgi:hypothetical protein
MNRRLPIRVASRCPALSHRLTVTGCTSMASASWEMLTLSLRTVLRVASSQSGGFGLVFLVRTFCLQLQMRVSFQQCRCHILSRVECFDCARADQARAESALGRGYLTNLQRDRPTNRTAIPKAGLGTGTLDGGCVAPDQVVAGCNSR